ncbi:aminomethyl transferase family protein [Lancefieldella parvula]|uniref:aminomethyl transferase family protein n=1 Tax=Lancefieldella parvula TaxID=1382 RepID=UPI0028D66346|nr:aminomethyl transferase family protein [Lancefieldella parvula]
MSEQKRSILHTELEYLGAQFSTSTEGFNLAQSFYGEKPLEEALKDCALIDLSGIGYTLVSGTSAQNFVEAVFAGKQLEVGETSFECALTGDGSLSSIGLLARSGQNEYVVLDASERSLVLDEWLSIIASVEQNGVAPYAEVSLEDATPLLTPLLLAGKKTKKVLMDYLGEQTLPEDSKLCNLMLDQTIPVLVANVSTKKVPAYLVMVPPVHTVILFRSLLSFETVHPLGHKQLIEGLKTYLPWFSELASNTKVVVAKDKLEGWGLLRASDDFIGARGDLL